MLEYTAVIQQYYFERLRHLPTILWALAKSSYPPNKVILWHNCLELDPSAMSEEWPALPVEVIKSEKNIMIGRYLAAMTAETDYVLMQDDDLIVERRLVERLIVEEIHDYQIGHQGRRLNYNSHQHRYTTGSGVYGGKYAQPANIVSRIWMAHKKALVEGIKLIASGELGRVDKPPLMRCDDTIFSLANGGAWVAAEIEEGGIKDIDENGVGMSHEEKHMEERDEGAKIITDAIDRRGGVR